METGKEEKMIQRYAVNGGVYPADNGILVYTADHLAALEKAIKVFTDDAVIMRAQIKHLEGQNATLKVETGGCSESYPADWGKVIVMVSPKGEVHSIGGETNAWGRLRSKLATIAEKEKELFAARQAILAGGIREGELMEQIEEQSNILNPGEYISEQERNGVTILVLRKDLWDVTSRKEK